MLNNYIKNVSGSLTTDTLRYTSTLYLPLKTTFQDSHYHEWVVEIQGPADSILLVYPCMREVFWHGDETYRTRLHEQCSLCQTKFTYKDANASHSHGIQLTTNCYSFKGMGRKLSGGYNQIVQRINEGEDAVTAVQEVVNS